jgi:hypothetical protein
MDRRSFVLSLFGGLAAAGLGGASIAQAAPAGIDPVPAAPEGEIDAALKARLDHTDADFTQVVRRSTTVRRNRFGRPVVVNRRVVVRRDRFGRPVRRVITTRRPLRRY